MHIEQQVHLGLSILIVGALVEVLMPPTSYMKKRLAFRDVIPTNRKLKTLSVKTFTPNSNLGFFALLKRRSDGHSGLKIFHIAHSLFVSKIFFLDSSQSSRGGMSQCTACPTVIPD